jgi:hypothetical protein
MFPVVLIGLEVACIAAIRWLVRRRGELVRRRALICPLDGTRTHAYVYERHGVSEPSDLLQCDRLQRGGTSCDRSCMRGRAQEMRGGRSARRSFAN